MDPWSESKDLALNWLTKIEPVLPTMEDSSLQPLVLFMEQVVGIADGRVKTQNETIPNAIARIKSQFQSTLPLLTYALLDSSGILEISEKSLFRWKEDAIREVRASVEQAAADITTSVTEAHEGIRKTAEEAVKDFELAKAKASKISVDSAEQQFSAAAHSLKRKATFWASLTSILFAGLVCILVWLWRHPPELVQDVMDAMKPGSKIVAMPVSIPLLIAASAYFTSIRLAIIGVLGIGMAFSLRMTRAYLHMIEHNQHKLRVTNSIEAFVAAVRTNEQKDLVLSKLVESVTEFGDSGILGKQGEASGLPSVIFESMTKNVGKAD